jgi:GNAT superfamily N-acetyltransferase
VIEARVLTAADLAAADAVLPLHRFDGWADDSTYLVAWDGPEPVGHVHIAWAGTELGLPELQDMYVLPGRRSEGIGTALAETAEELAARRGHGHCSLSVSDQNRRARDLYERLGYTLADLPPKRVQGTITIRGEPFEVDDTLLYFTKPIVDLAPGSSS